LRVPARKIGVRRRRSYGSLGLIFLRRSGFIFKSPVHRIAGFLEFDQWRKIRWILLADHHILATSFRRWSRRISRNLRRFATSSAAICDPFSAKCIADPINDKNRFCRLDAATRRARYPLGRKLPGRAVHTGDRRLGHFDHEPVRFRWPGVVECHPFEHVSGGSRRARASAGSRV
jgi:hypothetical protein